MRFWDSSALMPLLVDEPGSAGRLQELKADPAVLVWWGTPVECESALQRRLREGALDVEGARLARENLMRLAAAWREVPAPAVVRTLVVRLLRTRPLRAAGALQLAAALSLVQGGVAGLVFLTADLRLAEAAEIEGLGVGR